MRREGVSDEFTCSYCGSEPSIAGHLERLWERHIGIRCMEKEAERLGSRERVLYSLRRHKVAMVPLELPSEL